MLSSQRDDANKTEGRVDLTPTVPQTSQAAPDRSFSARWTRAINCIERSITTTLCVFTHHAASHPKAYVVGIIFFSIFIFVLGLLTNFYVELDDDILWTPAGSKPVKHLKWIEDTYDKEPREFILIVHKDGQNVLSQEGVRRTFEALDVLREAPGYDELCAQSEYVDSATGKHTCEIASVTSFWNDSKSVFEHSVQSDQDAVLTMSARTYPDDSSADIYGLMGYPITENGTLSFARSFFTSVKLPEHDDAKSVEKHALDNLLELQEGWDADGGTFKLEFLADRSFVDEFGRAIVDDIPLIPVVFIVMSLFTCLIFYKRDPVASRCMLGFGAVISVLLSIMTGYGLLFLIGVSFTSMTQILPFIMFGIGLDNAFIISGEYGRTLPQKDPVQRIDETIETVGLSISLTTMTSVLAFGLGCLSSIPAVYMLCYYAFPTVFINYIYQVLFFVSLIVIDEHRIQGNRRDCCLCCKGPNKEGGVEQAAQGRLEQPMADRIMVWYADRLLKPRIRIIVLICFAAMLCGFGYSASLLTQEFAVSDVLPSDSYISGFLDALDLYFARGVVQPYAYFRLVDQSDPKIRQQMEEYIDDLLGIEAIVEGPPFFWVRDLKKYAEECNATFAGLTFTQQLEKFLEVPGNDELYGRDILFDSKGDIIASRVLMFMSSVDIEDVKVQVKTLEDQRAVTVAQAINKGQSEWRFFTYHEMYDIWEFYSTAVKELIFTTIVGVVAVTGVVLVFIPHWTAALFVFPLISILYIDLLGFLQVTGAHVNAVSYISLVMSIGLLVDFAIHVLLRFYESPGSTRDEKVKETLRTMGSSILIGAMSTCLGITPLGFSTSEIFSTIFNCFLGLVLLGSAHGLVLLPVVLSLVGPIECIRSSKKQDDETHHSDERPEKGIEDKGGFTHVIEV